MSERKTVDELKDLIPIIEEVPDLVFEQSEEKEISKQTNPKKKVEEVSEIEDLPGLEFKEKPNKERDNSDNSEGSTKITEEDEKDAALQATFKTLKDKGIVHADNVESWEELDEMVSELPKRVESAILGNVPEIARKVIEFSLAAGQKLTKEELFDFVNQYNTELSNIPKSVDTIESARNYLNSIYKAQNITDIARTAMLDALEDEEDEGKALISEAKRIQEISANKPKETDKMIEGKNKISYQERLEANRFRKNVDKELENTGWKKERLDKVKSVLSTGEIRNVIGLAGNSPKALIQLANLATYYDKETGEFNFEDFIKQIASKDVDKVISNITKDNFTSVSSKSRGKATPEGPKKSLFDAYSPI